MKNLIAIISLFFAAFTASAQNCGQITNFEYTIQNNNNGTSTYDFWITVQSTSGGDKSVKYTIKCGDYTFIQNACASSYATSTVYHIGPYTVNTINGEVQLTWSGHTNSVCGGTTCIPQQVYQKTSLPVELSSFKLNKNDKSTVVTWTTASEKDNDKFIIEHSNDGHEYEQIGEVAGNGTTTAAQDYQYIDNNPAPGSNYYRLKQVDFNGNFEYSPVSSIEFENSGDIAVFPTIFNEVINVSLPEAIANEDVTLTIYNMQGVKVFAAKLEGSTQHSLTLPALQAGQYLVNISSVQMKKRMIIIKY